MALALYRKYRPRTFAEVIGQEHVTEPLSQALRSGRLHHAYLFSGPRGCGKTSSARILARSLNCEQGPTPEPCGACGSCRSLANDGAGSIDVIEIDAASHGGVDDARELREKAFFAPANSRYKIYVIDEAHMVSSAGFNALLKLVEEPPDYVKFIFATTEPEKVLGTIRSRTHHYPFRLIPPAVLRPYLQQLTDAEGIHVDPTVFPLVVRAGGGSARDTLSVLDQLIAGAGPEGVDYARAVALLGVTDVALIDEMCDALAAGDGAAAYQTIDRVAEAGHDPRRFASDLLERFRDLIVLQQVPDAVTKGLIDGPADQLEQMGAQATRLGPATLSRCADIVHNGLVEMRGTTAPRLLLELITARMLLPGADDSSGALLQRLERMERRLTLTSDHDSVRPEHPSPQDAQPSAATTASSVSGVGLSAARAAAAAARRGQAGGASPAAGAVAGSASDPVATPAPVDATSASSSGVANDTRAATAAAGHVDASEQSGQVDGDEQARHAGSDGQGGRDGSVTPPSVPSAAASASSLTTDASVPASTVAPGELAQAGTPVPAAPEPRRPEPAGLMPDASEQPRRPEPAGLMPDAPEEPGVAAAVVPGQLTVASIREVWPQIMVVVGRKSKKIAALVQGATVRELEGQTVVLTFRFPAHARMVAAEPQLIADALYEELGGRWQIRCDVAGESGPSQGGGGRPAPRGPQGGGGPASHGPQDSRGPQESGSQQSRPALQDAPEQRTPAQGRSASSTSARQAGTAPQASADEEDDGGWPEPVKPGGLAAPAASAAQAVTVSQAATLAQAPAAGQAVGQAPTAGQAVGQAPTVGQAVGQAPTVGQAVGQAATAAEVATAGQAATVTRAPVTGQAASTAQVPGTAQAPAAVEAPASAADEGDGDEWPEPAVPGRAGGSALSADSGAEADRVRPHAVPEARVVPRNDPPGTVGGSNGSTAPSRGIAAARAAAARGAAPAAGRSAPQAAPSGAAAGAARGHASGGTSWSDGSPTEEAPYDPEYDGPVPDDKGTTRGGSGTSRRGDGASRGAGETVRGGTGTVRSGDGAVRGGSGTGVGAVRGGSGTGVGANGTVRGGDGAAWEGFDPGDEPLDDVIDEKTARQSSEQQAVRLLQEVFGAEKISES